LQSAARAAGVSALITTEKDLVRLGSFAEAPSPPLAILTARLRIEIEDEAAAMDWLLARIRGLLR
jgi:tetraacyldisaccharide-1-P 4'-kinase